MSGHIPQGGQHIIIQEKQAMGLYVMFVCGLLMYKGRVELSRVEVGRINKMIKKKRIDPENDWHSRQI